MGRPEFQDVQLLRTVYHKIIIATNQTSSLSEIRGGYK